MRYLGAAGFEAADNDGNGIIFDFGGFFGAATTAALPPNSLSSYAFTFRDDIWHRPWYDGSTATGS